MEIVNFPLVEGFNSVYSEIENCTLIKPPYADGIIGKDFFAEKRGGLVNDVSLNAGTTKDAFVYRSSLGSKNIYYDGADLIVPDRLPTNITVGEITQLFPTTMPGEKLESGLATSGTPITLVDTAKTRVVDSLSGKYLYLSDGKGAGDTQLIISNTIDTITVIGWTNANQPDATTSYTIYEELVDTFIFSSITNNATYFFDGRDAIEIVTATLDADNNLNLLSVVYKGRRWFTDDKKRIYYSYEGQPVIIEGLLTYNEGEIHNLFKWGNYLLITSQNDISIIREVTVSLTTVFTIDSILNFGTLFEGTIFTYESGLFFLGSDKELYSLSVDISNNFVTGTIQLQSQSISGYLQEFDFDSFYHNEGVEGFTLGLGSGDETLEIIFSKLYKSFHTHRFQTKIYRKMLLVEGLYYLNNLGVGNLQNNSADLGETFEQNISFFFGGISGTPGLFSPGGPHIDRMKTIRYTNFSFGKQVGGGEVYLNIERNTASEVDSKSIDLNTTKYQEFQEEPINTFGESLFGESFFGGGVNLYDVLAKEGIVQVKGQAIRTGFLFKFTLTDRLSLNGFMFGGASLGFNPTHPYTHGLSQTK